MDLKGKVVVVTGSTKGIGFAIAHSCLASGAKVVVSSRQDENVRSALRSLSQISTDVSGTTCDVSRFDEITKLFNYALECYGGIDIWINNAGLSGGFVPLDELEAYEIFMLVNANLTGMMYSCKLVIPYFIRQKKGIIINMSGKGWDGKAASNTAVYAATKQAIISLTKSLAAENKCYPLSIHALVPGMVKTDFYTDIKTCARSKDQLTNLPYALEAFGVPAEEVGNFTVKLLSAEEPGKRTGKVFSLLKGRRLFRAIMLMMWYRLTGKLVR